MSRRTIIFCTLAGLLLAWSCSTHRKLSTLKGVDARADLTFMKESLIPQLDSSINSTVRDTFKVTGLNGEEFLIMKAVQNEEGEMVAHDVLNAATVTAKFRNVAEREGKVNINFQVIVPPIMVDSKWQLRLYPDMFVLGDSIRLEPIYITGMDYRQTQLRGYERYDRFVNSIIRDTSVFVNATLLDRFLRRNFKEVYAFKNDTTFVSDNEWKSSFGVTGPEAVKHYTYDMRVKINERKKSRMDQMFRKYVKSPIISEGLRLDTIVKSSDGSLIYDYIQQINTRPKLRKVDIYLSGEIYEQDKIVYSVAKNGPLTFYISSLSSFVDLRERYLTQVIERRVQADTRCNIEFASGKHDINQELGNNRQEIGRVTDYLTMIMRNESFDLDSVVVTSYASPEGKASFNKSLSLKRARSVSDYFTRVMAEYADSLRSNQGFSIDESGNVTVSSITNYVDMVSRSHGEDWDTLDDMIIMDTVMTSDDKNEYFALSNIELDRREYLMQSRKWYRSMRERLYPSLRSVRFNFYMHRKGMVKDTVHTTVLDSTYMKGVQALKDMDYETALVLLSPYNDINTAVAHLGLGHNVSALQILEKQKRDARINYMLAVVYSRKGQDREAVEYYMRSCEQDPSYVHRGNLDPEISALINRYGLNKEEEFEYSF